MNRRSGHRDGSSIGRFLHRLADASAKAFLDQLCRAIDGAMVSDREQDPNGGTAARSAVEGRVTAGLFSPVAQAC